jgi:hypothetical protein
LGDVGAIGRLLLAREAIGSLLFRHRATAGRQSGARSLAIERHIAERYGFFRVARFRSDGQACNFARTDTGCIAENFEWAFFEAADSSL